MILNTILALLAIAVIAMAGGLAAGMLASRRYGDDEHQADDVFEALAERRETYRDE